MTHTSTEQPEALRLAEMLDNGKWCNYEDRSAAATELRRQHARIAELELVALKADTAATHPTQQGLEQPWLQERHLTALKRFQETTDDSQPYDISNNFIKHLLAIGCLQNHGFGKYSITEFGNYVLNSWDGARELPFKSQIERDGEGYAAQAKQGEQV